MKNKAVLSAILWALCVVVNSCSHPSDATAPSSASEPSATVPEVSVTRVIAQRLSATVRLPAQLMPYEAVDVYPKVTGYVKWIKVDRGSKVRKGELIAQLEAPELMAQRAEADSKFQSAESQLAAGEAKLEADEATYQRMKAAAKTPGVVAPNDLEVAQKAAQSDQANVAALEKSVKAAQDALHAVTQLEDYLNITAPFDGQVTTRYVHPGALVGPAGGPGAMTPIVRVQTLTRDRLVVPVPEYDVAGIPKGTEVAFTVPSFPGRIFKAPIARISGAVDIKTRTMPVELEVRDPSGELDPGTFCEVEWPVRRTYPTLFVPASAVASDLERTFVIRVRNDHTKWVDVKAGATSGRLVEVFGGLKEGDDVAVRGTNELPSGIRVKAKVVPPGN